jgi:hypothetical protein
MAPIVSDHKLNPPSTVFILTTEVKYCLREEVEGSNGKKRSMLELVFCGFFRMLDLLTGKAASSTFSYPPFAKITFRY